MSNVFDILESLEATSSRLEKEKILRDNKDNIVLQRVFQASLDPYTTYGISKFKMPRAKDVPFASDNNVVTIFMDTLLPQLANRSLTGNDAKETVIGYFADMDKQQQKWCERILLRNLRLGATETTINKIWPGLIPTFEVALAEQLAAKCDQDGHILEFEDEIKFPVMVDPKLDGFRCIAVKRCGVVTLFKRSGEVVETAPTIKEALEKAPVDNFVFDGELMARDWNETASVVSSFKNKKGDDSLFYHAFDCMDAQEWIDQRCVTPFKDRVDRLAELIAKISHPNVRRVECFAVFSPSTLREEFLTRITQGYEGVMVKDMNAPYNFKRSKAVLKLKPYTSWEGVITGWYLGNPKKKWAGKFGGFYVMLPNGIETRVGSGFSDELREEITKNDPGTYVGQIAEVQGQPPLQVSGVIRFPVFLRFRDLADVAKEVKATQEKWLESFDPSKSVKPRGESED